jgi:hypothetical protein
VTIVQHRFKIKVVTPYRIKESQGPFGFSDKPV